MSYYLTDVRALLIADHMTLVYPDGRLCISILHEPGEDQYGYETSGERWLPVHTIESIVG